MQEPPFPSGSAWLTKVWNDHFALEDLHAALQELPGTALLLRLQHCITMFAVSSSEHMSKICTHGSTILALMPAGHILNTTAVAPTLWTDSFPPIAAIEPTLPDPQKPTEAVGFKEVFASDTEVIKQHATPKVHDTPMDFVS